ncbi:serine/threonine-protein kinase MARK2-like [Myotis daubentonii]|uniref:serine/threonine-protein kinase MARK2-like n=1 Tax=Myotis daubentonii TaxID=98922 RepID=UPI002872E02F|nr:serine/threonine-protein kinase MARK2-like [Myotis daubentonii]
MCDFFEDIPAKVDCQFGNYALLSKIGRGSFGQVRLARHLITSMKVAVKIVNCEDPADVAEEIDCLKELNHPNIIKLFEVVNTNHQVYMFMEYARGGTLYNYLKKWGPILETEAQAPFRQLLSAVHYCHQKHIVHHDIKPENILLDMGLNIKLADFGLSAVFCKEEKLSIFCGTPNYKAPELFGLEPYEGPKVDVWSMGVVLYKMLTGVRPFGGKTLEELEEHILSGHFSLPAFLSVPCHTLLKTMIDIDPGRRPNVGFLLQDAWVNIGEADQMTPYIEPACTDIDPQVTEIMRTLGYEQEEIESSLTEKKFNSVMGTYRILNMQLNTGIQTVKVSPRSSCDSNITVCTSEGTWRSETEGSNPRNTPTSPEFSVPITTPPGGLDWGIATPPIRVEVKRVIRSCMLHITPQKSTFSWKLEISGSIYTTEISECYKQGLHTNNPQPVVKLLPGACGPGVLRIKISWDELVERPVRFLLFPAAPPTLLFPPGKPTCPRAMRRPVPTWSSSKMILAGISLRMIFPKIVSPPGRAA